MYEKTKKRLLNAAITTLFGTAGTVHAAGFAIIEHSASGMGNAYAGASAIANDASTTWFNPAGLTRLKDRQITIAGHIIAPTADYSDNGSSINPAFTGGSAVPGSLTGPDDDGGTTGFIPNFYYVMPLSNQMVFGLGINAPFALSTEYEDDWVGRYQAVKSAIATVNINPSIGWKANQQLSIGGGLSVQYVHAELSQAIDSGAACLGNPLVPISTCTSLGIDTPSNAATDSFAELDADDWSFGFNLGLLYEFNDKTRIGISYRSSIEQDAEGEADFTLHPGLQTLITSGGSTQLVDTDIKASVELPETLSFSVAHQASDRLELLADATWTGWSNFDELRIKYDSAQSDSVTPEEWNDVWRYSIGANFKLDDRLTLRGGLAFDEEAIPNEQLRTPRIPGNDRTWVSIGAGYTYTANIHFDVGYAHLFVDDTDINHTDSTGYTLNGEYEGDVNILSAQMNWVF